MQKARFFDKYEHQLGDRQKKLINRMLDEGPDGFEGRMHVPSACSSHFPVPYILDGTERLDQRGRTAACGTSMAFIGLFCENKNQIP